MFWRVVKVRFSDVFSLCYEFNKESSRMFRSIFGSECVIVISHLVCSPGPSALFNPNGILHSIQISVGTEAVVDSSNSTM